MFYRSLPSRFSQRLLACSGRGARLKAFAKNTCRECDSCQVDSPADRCGCWTRSTAKLHLPAQRVAAVNRPNCANQAPSQATLGVAGSTPITAGLQFELCAGAGPAHPRPVAQEGRPSGLGAGCSCLRNPQPLGETVPQNANRETRDITCTPGCCWCSSPTGEQLPCSGGALFQTVPDLPHFAQVSFCVCACKALLW